MKTEVWCVRESNIIEFFNLTEAKDFSIVASELSKHLYKVAIVNDKIWCVREDNIIQFSDLDAAEEYADEFSDDANYSVGLVKIVQSFLQ
jgi:hypothetical protein